MYGVSYAKFLMSKLLAKSNTRELTVEQLQNRLHKEPFN
jgi:hypothetical protein